MFKSFSQVPIERITEHERKAICIQVPTVTAKPSPISPKMSTINLKREVNYPTRVKAEEEAPSIETLEPDIDMAPRKKPRAYAPFKSPKIVGLPRKFLNTIISTVVLARRFAENNNKRRYWRPFFMSK